MSFYIEIVQLPILNKVCRMQIIQLGDYSAKYVGI